MSRTKEGRKTGGDDYVNNVAAIPAPIEHDILFTSGSAFTNWDYKFAGTSESKLWVHATGANYAGGESLTIELYRGNFKVGEAVVSTPATTDGLAVSAVVSIADMQYCDRAKITGTLTNPSGGTIKVYLGKLGLV